MITAVGGGREVLALEPMGYELETFECNPHLDGRRQSTPTAS